MFNQDIKNKFIDSVGTSGRVFELTSKYEMDFGKDLYNFNLNELNVLYVGMNFDDIETAETINAQIEDYIDWSIEQGFKWSNVNPLRSSDTKWLKQFVK